MHRRHKYTRARDDTSVDLRTNVDAEKPQKKKVKDNTQSEDITVGADEAGPLASDSVEADVLWSGIRLYSDCQ
jgi:hypothetical protein